MANIKRNSIDLEIVWKIYEIWQNEYQVDKNLKLLKHLMFVHKILEQIKKLQKL